MATDMRKEKAGIIEVEKVENIEAERVGSIVGSTLVEKARNISEVRGNTKIRSNDI